MGLGYYTPGLVTTATPITGNERIGLDTMLPGGSNPQTAYVTTSGLASYMGGGLPIVAGRFYGAPLGTTLEAVLTVTATLYAYPIYIPNATTLKTFNIGVTTGQTGGAAHYGIYADNGAGYPGALVVETGAVAGLTSTTVVTSTLATAQALNAGWYWVASIFTATSTFASVTGIKTLYTGVVANQLGSDTAAHYLAVSGQAPSGISVAGTYGALPLTFTTGATLILNADCPMACLGF